MNKKEMEEEVKNLYRLLKRGYITEYEYDFQYNLIMLNYKQEE